MSVRVHKIALVLVCATLLAGACAPRMPGTLEPTPPITLIPLLQGTRPATATAGPTATGTPTAAPSPSATTVPSATPTATLPPPQPPEPVSITAPDGIILAGTYYRAAGENTPLVVLVHQARGTQQDWWEKGYIQYLRNQGEAYPAENFVSLPAGVHFSVFTFDLRGHGKSKGEYNPDNAFQFMSDIRAALEAARSLPGVDPNRVAAVGSSTGSVVVLRCDDLCAGVMSISLYPSTAARQSIETLTSQGRVVFCVSEFTCPEVNSERYVVVQYAGAGHGYDLLNPALDPPPGQVLYSFLQMTFGFEP